MQGIVSALPQPYEQKVLTIWEQMERLYGAKFAQTALIPHITWHLAMQNYDMERLIPKLDSFCKLLRPLQVNVKGAASFPGSTIYLKVIKSATLSNLHQNLCELLKPFAHSPNLLYIPQNWVPHITIVHQDLSDNLIKEVLESLNKQAVDWVFQTDNFVILNQENDFRASLIYRFQFGEGLVFSA